MVAKRKSYTDSTVSPNKALGKAIKELRTKTGFSQEELSDRCRLDRTYVSGIERGIRNPTLQSLWVIADGLGVKPSELLKIAERILGGAE